MTHVFQHLRTQPSDFDGVELYALHGHEPINSTDVQFLEPAKCETVTFAVYVHVREGSARFLTHGGGVELVIEFPDYMAAWTYAQSLADALGVPQGSIVDQASGPAHCMPHRFYKQARTLLRR
jgi:hypothetical protein